MKITVGKIIKGVKILALEIRKTRAGQSRNYVQFRCACGEGHWTLLSVVTRATTGTKGRRHTLRCAACQEQQQRKCEKKDADEMQAKPEPSTTTVPGVPQVCAEVYGRFMRLAGAEKIIADRIIYAHVRACLLNGSPVENADRLFIEAMDIAKQEARSTPPVETRANEPFWRYDIYVSPRID